MTTGPHSDNIATIVNVVDQNRVYRIKHLHLTKFTTKFPFNARSKIVKGAWESDKISEQWSGSSWAKRMERRALRSTLTDFDRFKLAKAKAVRNKILARAVNIKKKKLTRAGKL
ncbi:60S ribosomal protein L14 [Caligus rogercresseyi]|uniref:Large ribosomal subunit protein eL14 n=1 Tax=Caligus rogercresseyi TaxID=217165 RepID=A0A7T8KH69_CALRO|nr:60S ribosomal protein L14 [Caligus rogercresseyi]